MPSSTDRPQWLQSTLRHEVQADGDAMGDRPRLNFSSDFTLSDSQSNDSTNVGLSAFSGSVASRLVSLEAGGRLLRTTSYTTPTTGSHSYVSTTDSVIVWMVGGGGGGGGALGHAAGAGQGGGASAGNFHVLKFSISSAVTGTSYLVGHGGAGGTGSLGSGAGSSGGPTSWWTPTAQRTAIGGTGGSNGVSTDSTVQAAGGNASTAATLGESMINATGEDGEVGTALKLLGSSGSLAFGGDSGSSFFGGGQRGPNANSDGNDGGAPGAGGSGARVSSSATSRNGGTGAPGAIVVFEYAGPIS